MNYYILLTILSFFFTNLNAEIGQDEMLKVKKVPFLDFYFKREGFLYPAIGPSNTFIHLSDPVFAAKPQILLKNGNIVSISLAASGRIYECIGEDDSSFLFKRIDHSPSQNYNIGGYYFFHDNKLYCFSGYGYWKSHGTLKVFNKNDREWDLIPMKKEIIPQLFQIGNSWYDEKDQKLYVPFQSVVNAGITGEENLKGVIESSSMVLDLKNYKWEKVGEATENTIEMIRNGSHALSTHLGLLIRSGQDIFLLDYKHNTIKKSRNVSFNQSILRSLEKGFLYYSKNYIYHYNPDNGSTDSTEMPTSDFQELDMPIWEDDNDSLLILRFFIPICAFIFFLLVINKNWQTQISPPSSSQTLKKKNIEFTDVEKSLLNLLWNKTISGTAATVSEVNYSIGVKDKKTGLQKKVRSDIFNSINEKYSFLINKQEPLILTIRSEEDKRFFEFRLTDDSIQTIKEYLL